MGDQVHDDVMISAPLEDVLAVILDLEAYPEWSDDVKSVEVLERDDQGRPVQAHFNVDARVALVDYTLRYDHDTDGVVTWTLTEGEVLRQLDGRYDLVASDDGSTHVTYGLEADIAMPVPRFLKKRATKTILETGLTGLKRRVESLA